VVNHSPDAVLATVLSTRGLEESAAFARAVLTAIDRGAPPRCTTGGDLWVSESVEDRRHAARLCNGCSVISECRRVAEARGEKFAVWGGRDFSPQSKRRADAA
jgi:hypothetical protein